MVLHPSASHDPAPPYDTAASPSLAATTEWAQGTLPVATMAAAPYGPRMPRSHSQKKMLAGHGGHW